MRVSLIGDKQRLLVGLGTAKAEAVNGLGAEGNFTTDPAGFPERVHQEGVGQELDAPLVIGAANENDLGVAASRAACGRPGEACGAVSCRAWDLTGWATT